MVGQPETEFLMRLGGRAQAAIEVLEDMDRRKRPASEALKDWGNSHRFAGSGDRAAIGNLVYDGLRNRALNAWLIGSQAPRGVVMSTLIHNWGLTKEEIRAQFENDNFAPAPVTEAEARALAENKAADAPDVIRANVPDWCVDSLAANFGMAARSHRHVSSSSVGYSGQFAEGQS